ncbi:MAG TPA: ATP-dependent DNA helicase PcrA, partial [Actinomycetota bacterium]
QTSFNPPSRFLGEIPEQLLDVREAESRRSYATRRTGERRRPDGSSGGYTVIGLPGASGAVQVDRGWTAPAPAGVARREAPAIKEGDTVRHDRWGEGVVLVLTGAGDDAEATIRFSDVGEKRVLLAYAPLTKV